MSGGLIVTFIFRDLFLPDLDPEVFKYDLLTHSLPSLDICITALSVGLSSLRIVKPVLGPTL